ncbi:MAG TPA: carboxypeptidase-like regulatory domain-containing protein, partial [Planctomycetota bacterium]
MTRNSRFSDRGGIPLPVLLLAVVLLGAVLYAVLQGGGGSTSIDDTGAGAGAGTQEPAGLAVENFDGSNAPIRAPLAGTEGPGRVALGGSAEGQAAGPVSGRVVDGAGKGIAQAKVQLTERLDDASMFRAEQESRAMRRFTVETDRTGKYTVTRLPVSAEFDVWVHHPDYAPAPGAPVTPLPGENQELPTVVLGSGYRVFGVVLAASGAPVAAELEVTMQPTRFVGPLDAQQLEEDDVMGKVRKITADPNGAFDVTNLAQGIYSLRASAPGHATEFITPVLLQGETRESKQQIQLGEEKRIRGIVLDETREPVGGAQIIAGRTRPRSMLSETVFSEADGSFELRGLTEGNYSLHVTAEGFSPGRQGNVNAGQEDLEILLHHKGGVSGRVIDANGSPVTRFSMEVYRVHQGTATYGYLGLRRDFDDANGNYVMPDLDPGSYVLMVSADGFSPTYSPGFY